AISYGQYPIEGNGNKVSSGSICFLGELDSSSANILLNTVASYASDGLVPVSLSKLLYGRDKLADSEGIQHE
ncbi:MAG TPA: hypothetical protein PLT66_05385, partial [Bacillota bacterium]|nr:hypothetical protein [Bacillota bacterium]